MGTNYIPESISAGLDTTSTLNTNLTNIQTSLGRMLNTYGDNTVGTNAMNSDLDMNSKRGINAARAINASDYPTLSQVQAALTAASVQDVTNVSVVNTAANLKALSVTSLDNLHFAIVKFNASTGDKDGATYYYDDTETAADNGVDILAPDAGTGRWKLISAGIFQDQYDNLTIGTDAGSALTAPTIAGHNTFVGFEAGKETTAPRDNTYIGYQAGKSNVDDAGANGYGGNTAVGSNSFDNNTVGYQNTALGNTALNDSVSGNFNTAVGWGALQKNLLSNNTAVGILAGGIGPNTDDSVLVGMFAMTNCNKTVSKNTAVGFATASNFGQANMGALDNGNGNAWFGTQAGGGMIDGARNTMIGGATGFHGATIDIIGDDNTYLGYQAGDTNVITGGANTLLGAYSDVPEVATGTTTSTTANKLVDSSQQFDEIVSIGMTIHNTSDTSLSGNHDGSSGAAVLTDSGESWTVNELVGRQLLNTTDGSKTTITSNTATTITGVLAGGTDNDWDAGDSYILRVGFAAISAIDSATTLSIDKDIMLTGENYEIYDENNCVVLGPGGSADSPEVRYYSDSVGDTSIVEPSTIGRYVQSKSSETVTAYTGGPSAVVVQVNVPAGAKILGAIVKLDVEGAANDTWNAAYSGGSVVSIATTGAGTSGTTISAMFDDNAASPLVTSETDVTFTKAGGGNFTDTGTFRAVVFYEAIKLFKN